MKYKGRKIIYDDYQALQSVIELINKKLRVSDELKLTDCNIVIRDNRITELSIYDRGLTSIPEVLNKLTGLEIIGLQCNKISEISGLDGLIKLSGLFLGGNNINPNDSKIRELMNKGVTVYI